MSHTKTFPNLIFHTILEKEVLKIGYGQLTFNAVLKDGVVLVKTMKVTRSKRKRYPLKPKVTVSVTKIGVDKQTT